eukprot:gb/GECH01004136.1/.p1 GENE.gb/GECH01004136.1/~~gb/GECH01004136.1/.p1  ORF type:complete len:180 (+),score=67.13 gb/GECH01004136.1/:1-540(+)
MPSSKEENESQPSPQSPPHEEHKNPSLPRKKSKRSSSKQKKNRSSKQKQKQQEQKQKQNQKQQKQPPETTHRPSSSTKSTVKTYRPPDGSPPVLCIHTRPHLMKKLRAFFEHFDRPPQQLFLEFVFVEVAEEDAAQFRYRLEHPVIDSVYGRAADADVPLSQRERRRHPELPDELLPRL